LYHLFAPAGGCRVDEWGDFGMAENLIHFVRKHRPVLKSHMWWELWRAFRLGVLNRQNLARPHRLVAKSARFLVALLRLFAAGRIRDEVSVATRPQSAVNPLACWLGERPLGTRPPKAD
jgi:hypothetical protein